MRGDMGRGRGRGRGGRFGGADHRPKWTPRKGDADAMRLLKRLRDGKQTSEEMEAIQEFVNFVEETLTSGKEMGEHEVQAG
jgi:NADH:ubiquinone oxidoreductase subunit F (NADH-binding)